MRWDRFEEAAQDYVQNRLIFKLDEEVEFLDWNSFILSLQLHFNFLEQKEIMRNIVTEMDSLSDDCREVIKRPGMKKKLSDTSAKEN